MVKAKIGFEDLFDSVVAKQAALKAEKENAISEAVKAIDADFADRENRLTVLFEQVSEITKEEEIVVEEEIVAEEKEEEVSTNPGNVTIAG